jgi:hypothetical protein
MFSWLAVQDYFKELHDNDIRARMYQEQREAIEADMAPFGFMDDGLTNESFVDPEGQVWHTDEYGDRSYMWDYK